MKNKHNILYDKIQNKLSAPHFSQLIFQIALKKCHVTSRLAVLQCKKEIFLNFYTAYQEKKPSPPETRSYIPSVGWKDFVTATRTLHSSDLVRQNKTNQKCLLPSSQQGSPSSRQTAWLTGWALLPWWERMSIKLGVSLVRNLWLSSAS